MTNVCPHCGETHSPHTRFCPLTGTPLQGEPTSSALVEEPGTYPTHPSKETRDQRLFARFLHEDEELQETFYLGRTGIFKPTRVWIALTDHRVLALVIGHYFFQEATGGAKVLHSFSLPIHHLRFEEPSHIELIIVLVICGLLAFVTFGATLLLFLLWWVRVYKRKGFVIDGEAFLCSGRMEAVWRAIKMISGVSEKYATTHGA